MNEKKLIFIVDDDPLINTLVVKRLTAEGYNLEAYVYGEDCLKELSRNPDLIILDYFFINKTAEVMNGLEVFEKIKKVKPKMPVIMLSAQEKGEVVLELARKGIDDYVIKDHNLIDNLNIAIKEIFDR
jgi:CheY-like chemotaxis protein